MDKRTQPNRMSLAKRVRSFSHASRGIWLALATQPNAMLQLAVAIVAVVLGLFFGISLLEWAIVVICIAAVMSAEAFNTALEFLADGLEPEHNPTVGRAKDIAAGAVLLVSFGSAVAGLLIYVPHIFRAIQG